METITECNKVNTTRVKLEVHFIIMTTRSLKKCGGNAKGKLIFLILKETDFSHLRGTDKLSSFDSTFCLAKCISLLLVALIQPQVMTFPILGLTVDTKYFSLYDSPWRNKIGCILSDQADTYKRPGCLLIGSLDLERPKLVFNFLHLH